MVQPLSSLYDKCGTNIPHRVRRRESNPRPFVTIPFCGDTAMLIGFIELAGVHNGCIFSEYLMLSRDILWLYLQ